MFTIDYPLYLLFPFWSYSLFVIWRAGGPSPPALCLPLAGKAAGLTETVLEEGDAAPGTVLGPDTAELRTTVAVTAPGSAAAGVAPIHAHESLPIRIIAQGVHPVPEQSVQC